MSSTDQFVQAAHRAAPEFALDPRDIRVLSHSENVVCDVELADDQHVIMRLHRPGYNSLNELASEVQWVQALGESGVPVPHAIPTTSGDYYTTVTVGSERRHVGVVGWVPGQPLGGPLDGARSDIVGFYGRIGQLAAQIRVHSNQWQPPATFVRRQWDANGLVGETPLWGRFWEVSRLSSSQQELFAQARLALQDELGALPKGPDLFGLIHADLHLGNVMADGDELTVIDFDDAGFGWFAHELAVALHPVLGEATFEAARAAILEGYREIHRFSHHEEQLLDTFLTMRCLMIVGWLSSRSELAIYAHFDDLVAQATTSAEEYLGRQ